MVKKIWRSKLLFLGIFMILILVGALMIVNDMSTKLWIAYTLLRMLAWQVIAMLLKKDQSSDLKIPWVIFLALTPLLGIVTYYMFGTVHVGNSFKTRYEKVYYHSLTFKKDNDEVYMKLDKINPVASSYAFFVKKCGKMDLYQNTITQYFSSGETYFNKIKEELNKATKFIFLEFFKIGEGRLLNEILSILEKKIKEGVEVYLLYDDLGSLAHIPKNYNRKLKQIGINAVSFHKFKPVVSLAYNNRNHRKSVIIDGTIAFIGGSNLADEYVNYVSKFGYFKDSGLRLEGDAVKGLTLLFLQTYHATSGWELDYEKYLLNNHKIINNNFILPFGDGPYDLYHERISETVYMNVINQAVDYIYITTPYLIIDYYIALALKNAALRGVDVRIIMPGIPDKKLVYYFSKSNYHHLMECGVKIYEYTPGFVHAKTIVSDDNVAIVGSINMDFRSFIHHMESAVLLYNDPSIKQVKEDIMNCIDLSKLISKEEAKLKWHELFIRNTFILFKPLF